MDLTNEDVADILALLDSLPYDSLDLETTRFRLTLRRAPGGGWTEESQVLTDPVVLAPAADAATALAASTRDDSGRPRTAPGTAPPPGPQQAGTARAGTPAKEGAAADGGDAASDGLAAVTAPLPGTFYRAPRPGAEPFVQVGDAVSPDTVVAIIETMKLMNPVRAGTTGRVARISLENGDFAPLGATLMLIEPDQ
jgi:acetyl-CoA carboxylase biotin carboxyl carrier protein